MSAKLFHLFVITNSSSSNLLATGLLSGSAFGQHGSSVPDYHFSKCFPHETAVAKKAQSSQVSAQKQKGNPDLSLWVHRLISRFVVWPTAAICDRPKGSNVMLSASSCPKTLFWWSFSDASLSNLKQTAHSAPRITFWRSIVLTVSVVSFTASLAVPDCPQCAINGFDCGSSGPIGSVYRRLLQK